MSVMFYKPPTGRFKDNYIVWHEGKFYLYSMYMHKDIVDNNKCEDYRNIWLATSEDGVHWDNIGPVILNSSFIICSMSVHEVNGKFILNHGSFSNNKQNVLRFWESYDLIHWTYMGEEYDLKPDPRWYDQNSRLDTMDVIKENENGSIKYYGYATGPGGFLESNDGIHWFGISPQRTIEWGSMDPPPGGYFEIGGCEKINGRYYLLGGSFNYMGYSGYGVYTHIGDTPAGPFKPDFEAYRLNGNSIRWVTLWARFCRMNSELLINNYMVSGFTIETGETWLPPLKKAIIDKYGHLRLGYWNGNDSVKGRRIIVDLHQCNIVFPKEENANSTHRFLDINKEIKNQIKTFSTGIEIEAEFERGSVDRTNIPTIVALLCEELDMEKGIVVEGSMQITCKDKKQTLVAPGIGIYLEERDQEGTAIILDTVNLTRIGNIHLHDSVAFCCEDETRIGCAAVAGISPHILHSFRLLIRKNMFELYLDDFLIQTYNTTHNIGSIGLTPRRLGFLVQNGIGIFKDINVWQMNLD